jgi:hypothetical protein
VNRLGTGLTAATIPLVIALGLAQTNHICLAVVAFTLTALVILGTFANVLPLLHHLPSVGAPHLDALLYANGSADLKIQIAAPRHDRDRSEHSVLLRVGVKNPTRADVEHALVNFLVPVGLGLQICDHRGRPLDEGRLMPPTQESDAFDYWALGERRFTGRNSTLLHFKIWVTEPGEYALKLRLQSKDLYEELVVDGTLTVREVNGELPPRHVLGDLIDYGERLLQQNPIGSQYGTDVRDFVGAGSAALAKMERPRLERRYNNARIEHQGDPVGSLYSQSLLRAKVAVLYDLRDALGHEGLA